jgi:hypothetical protein
MVFNKTFNNISVISWWSVLLGHGNWIYNYLCNQYLSTLKLWVQIPFMVRCVWYNIMWSSLSVTCGRSVVFSVYSGILYQYKCRPRYNWNIVERDIITVQNKIITGEILPHILQHVCYINITNVTTTRTYMLIHWYFNGLHTKRVQKYMTKF